MYLAQFIRSLFRLRVPFTSLSFNALSDGRYDQYVISQWLALERLLYQS